MERHPLDDIDLKILSELQRDGRIRNNELAERVGLSEPPCRRRVRALRERGYVSAIRATLDETLLGYDVISFVLIQLQSQAQAPLQAFEKSIAAVPLVLQSWRISGDADYLLKCVARNVEGMHQQLLQFSAMAEVRNIRTFPVLGVAKDAPLPIPNYPAASDRRRSSPATPRVGRPGSAAQASSASKPLVRPRLDALEGEIVGVGGRPAHRILGLDHLVGNALALAIGDRVFLGVEVQGELLLHVAGRGPAHQGLDRPGLLGLVIELPFPGHGPTRLHRVFGGLKNACGHGWLDPQAICDMVAFGGNGRDSIDTPFRKFDR
jgi:DNA-binding Lrp family transcriptional regulator